MKSSTLLLLLLMVTSCAHPPNYRLTSTDDETPPIQTVTLEPNKQLWLGRHEEKLALHPIFATFPVETRVTPTGTQTRRYVEGGAITSDGQCTGGNCAGITGKYECNHVFYIKKSLITNYHRVGPHCGKERLEMRPMDENGEAEYSKGEIEQARAIASLKVPVKKTDTSCSTRADCSDGMTCKISDSNEKGVCVRHGIFGKLFNN